MTIPAGYALSIRSWENDADCYKTQNFYGLTAPDVMFLLDLAKLFKSMNSNKGGMGGASWHYKGGEEKFFADVYDAIDKVVKKHSKEGVSADLLAEWTVDRSAEYYEDTYNELIAELVGYPEEEMYRSDGYIRVFDSHTVWFYPTEIEDVTKKFK